LSTPNWPIREPHALIVALKYQVIVNFIQIKEISVLLSMTKGKAMTPFITVTSTAHQERV
jgi:hypothetical protein